MTAAETQRERATRLYAEAAAEVFEALECPLSAVGCVQVERLAAAYAESLTEEAVAALAEMPEDRARLALQVQVVVGLAREGYLEWTDSEVT